jgi:organic hydroperoxide reductase OsmC/OhrA
MEYKANILWNRNDHEFKVKTYDRTHTINFGSGLSIEASSAPEFMGSSDHPNPEELFTAAISSCFMLTFLYWAAMKGVIVNEYNAETTGNLGKNAEGKMAMTELTIKPSIIFHEGNMPAPELLQELLQKAHDNCFISSSVKTNIIVKTGHIST